MGSTELLLATAIVVLVLTGCDQDRTETPVEDARDAIAETTGGDDRPEADVPEGEEPIAAAAWQQAAELAAEAEARTRYLSESEERRGTEAWERMKADARHALERADEAMEDASAYTGDVWDDLREEAEETLANANAAWEEVREE